MLATFLAIWALEFSQKRRYDKNPTNGIKNSGQNEKNRSGQITGRMSYEPQSGQSAGGLCGKPLSEECGDSKDLEPPSSITVEKEEEKGSALEFCWRPIVMGYGCGLVIGIVVRHFVISRRYDWFVYTFGVRLPKYRYKRNAGLCGKPLSEECGDLKDLQPPSSSTVEEEKEKGSTLEFGWKPIVTRYGCWLVIGIVVCHFVISRRYDWFVYTFGIRLAKNKVATLPTILDMLANLSSLTIVDLEDCGLYDEFPTQIFQLPDLEFLSMLHNQQLKIYLLEFH
ncbi:hypothetical protein FEM48_Zijuj04G0130000 [Ziziphus jujuba var. spinosa]|uniref:Uncharacterized protein n=1 Tax=Ziziphus jujuba var. spinosa TaxID=714518 RepID=A0A978VK13_ZIZJJ|nr:hypothetical protein FEM48_Zijuj04G0130000 [Ziziphus jujuba var. spinosa]